MTTPTSDGEDAVAHRAATRTAPWHPIDAELLADSSIPGAPVPGPAPGPAGAKEPASAPGERPPAGFEQTRISRSPIPPEPQREETRISRSPIPPDPRVTRPESDDLDVTLVSGVRPEQRGLDDSDEPAETRTSGRRLTGDPAETRASGRRLTGDPAETRASGRRVGADPAETRASGRRPDPHAPAEDPEDEAATRVSGVRPVDDLGETRISGVRPVDDLGETRVSGVRPVDPDADPARNSGVRPVDRAAAARPVDRAAGARPVDRAAAARPGAADATVRSGGGAPVDATVRSGGGAPVDATVRSGARPVDPDRPRPGPAGDSGFHMPLLRETIARAGGRPHDVTRPGDSMSAMGETVASASSTLRGPVVVTDAGRPRRSAADNEPLPRAIGRFAILRRLGAGGMGTVYSAYDEELARKVAIKVLHLDAFPHERRAMLLSEARAMARLSHPHVVQIHELGDHADGIFLVMEYVEGPTLEVWLQAAGRTWESILRMFVAAGEGLAAAHQAGLVHRDFKPDNVLIAGGETPKVADFGLARPGDLGGGPIAGTPLYMSPEQHLGGRVGPPSDLFSFCVALYRALYDQAPFAGESLAELRESVTEGALQPPPAGSAVPTKVRDALLRGLALEIGDRWPSMDALLEALRAALPQGPNPWVARVLFGGVGAALAALVVVVLLRPASPPPATFAAVAEGSLVAHACAGAAEWIYPGDRDPARTAIRRIVGLEAIEGPGGEYAHRQAAHLRRTFGDELAALGDRYWEDPRTRPYARDFYAQTLVFLPDHAVALQRGNFSPGQLAELRDQAIAGSFTPEQLAAVAPLKILADLDDPDLQAKIAALARTCDEPLSQQEPLASGSPRTPRDVAADAPTSPDAAPDAPSAPDTPTLVPVTPPDAPEAAPEVTPPDAATPTPTAPTTTTPTAPRTPRPLTGVDALIAQAENARRQGKDGEAAGLFRQALTLSPRDATAVAALSDIAFDRGDYREAETLAAKAIKLAPDIGEHRTRRGDARFKLGDTAGARADFEEALALGDHRARRRLDLLGEGPP